MIKYSKFLLLILVFFQSTQAQGSENVALSEFVNNVRGSFNMLVAEPNVVGKANLNKTRKMIKKGYRNEVRNMQGLLQHLDVKANIRKLSAKRYPNFSEQEDFSEQQLQALITDLSNVISERFDLHTSTSNASSEATSDSMDFSLDEDLDLDDIGSDIELTDEMIDLTDEVLTTGSVDLGKRAKETFLEIGSAYGELFSGMYPDQMTTIAGKDRPKYSSYVTSLKQAYIPYGYRDLARPHHLHAIFGTTFFPTRHGVEHVMKIHVLLLINEAEHNNVRVGYQRISPFMWNRNPYFISAATGSVLKQIFTEALGSQISFEQ